MSKCYVVLEETGPDPEDIKVLKIFRTKDHAVSLIKEYNKGNQLLDKIKVGICIADATKPPKKPLYSPKPILYKTLPDKDEASRLFSVEMDAWKEECARIDRDYQIIIDKNKKEIRQKVLNDFNLTEEQYISLLKYENIGHLFLKEGELEQ